MMISYTQRIDSTGFIYIVIVDFLFFNMASVALAPPASVAVTAHFLVRLICGTRHKSCIFMKLASRVIVLCDTTTQISVGF
jgi:hypothetical protein